MARRCKGPVGRPQELLRSFASGPSTEVVKPYVKTDKNDAADAGAICEAVGRPNMWFVPIKNTEQQAVLGLHRARQRVCRHALVIKSATQGRVTGLNRSGFPDHLEG
jgi:transposase